MCQVRNIGPYREATTKTVYKAMGVGHSGALYALYGKDITHKEKFSYTLGTTYKTTIAEEPEFHRMLDFDTITTGAFHSVPTIEEAKQVAEDYYINNDHKGFDNIAIVECEIPAETSFWTGLVGLGLVFVNVRINSIASKAIKPIKIVDYVSNI